MENEDKITVSKGIVSILSGKMLVVVISAILIVTLGTIAVYFTGNKDDCNKNGTCGIINNSDDYVCLTYVPFRVHTEYQSQTKAGGEVSFTKEWYLETKYKSYLKKDTGDLVIYQIYDKEKFENLEYHYMPDRENTEGDPNCELIKGSFQNQKPHIFAYPIKNSKGEGIALQKNLINLKKERIINEIRCYGLFPWQKPGEGPTSELCLNLDRCAIIEEVQNSYGDPNLDSIITTTQTDRDFSEDVFNLPSECNNPRVIE